MKLNYLKYIVPYQLIFDRLKRDNYKNVIFYLDVLGISRGFYNRAVIEMEIGRYLQTQQLPDIYPKELKYFLNQIYNRFKYYRPKFISFYDGGQCLQNTTISKFYKEERASQKYFYLEEKHKELFNNIKNYYLNEIDGDKFNRRGLGCIIKSKEYELDLIPHYVISKNFLNSQDPKTLNVILSVDKDLLQTCRFENVVQAVSTYKKSKGIEMKLFDKYNAVSYIYPKFKMGGLTAEYVPLILALSGDKIDGIKSIPRMGPAMAIKTITQYRMPPIIRKEDPLPDVLEEYRDLIVGNLKLTSFDMQIGRIPITETNKFERKLNAYF